MSTHRNVLFGPASKIVPSRRNPDIHDREFTSNFWGGGHLVGLKEAIFKDATEVPLHSHRGADELFIVLHGKLTMTADGQQYVIRPGESLFVPAGVPHSLRADSGTKLLTVLVSAPGHEEDKAPWLEA